MISSSIKSIFADLCVPKEAIRCLRQVDIDIVIIEVTRPDGQKRQMIVKSSDIAKHPYADEVCEAISNQVIWYHGSTDKTYEAIKERQLEKEMASERKWVNVRFFLTLVVWTWLCYGIWRFYLK